MDVYVISDAQSFRDSTSTASPSTASPTTGSDPPTSPETPGVEGRRGGSAAPFPSLLLSLFVIVIVVLSL